MNKIAEPTIVPTLTDEEQAYYDARTLQGLAEAERGEGISVAKARRRMQERIVAANAKH